MPGLSVETVDVIFAGGLDTKTDQRQVALGKFLVLKNLVFTALKKLRRRFGHSALSTSVEGGGSISTVAALFARAAELVLVDSNNKQLLSYDPSRTNWVYKGVMPSTSVSVLQLGGTKYSVRDVDMAIASNGLICSVYQLYDQNAVGTNTYKGIYYSIVDSSTGQMVTPPTVLDLTSFAILPRVVAIGTNFVFYWVRTDFAATWGIFGATLPITTPTGVVGGAAAITSGVGAQALNATTLGFDAAVQGTNVYLAFTNRSGTPGTTTFQLGTAAPTTVTGFVTLANTQATSHAVVPDLNGNIVIAYVNGGNTTVAAVVYNAALVQQANPTIENALTTVTTVTGVSTAANTLTFFYSGSSLADFRGVYMRSNTLTTGAYTPGAAVRVTGMFVGGKAFTSGGQAYCIGWFSTNGINAVDTQSAVFLVNATLTTIYGSALNGGAAGTFFSASNFGGGAATPVTTYTLGSTVSVNGVFYSAQARSTRVIGSIVPNQVGSALLYQFAPCAVGFNLADTTNAYARVQAGNYVLAAGSVPYMYDGSSVVEQGFLQNPTDIIGAAAGGGSLTANANYPYFVTYEWMDAQGQIHRSAPGPVVGSTNIGANSKVTLTIPTLKCSAKSNVLITVWRTVANGSVYYQVNNIAGLAAGANNLPIYNDPTVNTVTFVDVLADTAITSNPQLYTTGGVVANSAPNPLNAVTVHRGRVFGIDPQNGQVWYTKQIVPPAPLEFSVFNVMNVDTAGGNATALGSLDDKFIIFKANRIFYVFGQGPDSTGGNNDFTDPMPLPGDVGCPYPKSVISVPNLGIIFQSQKGYFLLGRDLSLTYIGADVESFTQYQASSNAPFSIATSATIIPDTTQVRFTATFSSGSTYALVYDWQVGQWSIFTSSLISNPVDACIWTGGGKNAFCMPQTNGVVLYEDSTKYNDNGSFVQAAWTTPWIHLSKLQGYQRVYEMALLGKYVPDSQSTQTVTLTIDYGYVNGGGDSQTVVWGANNSPSFSTSIRIKPKRPRRESIQLAWSDSWSGGAWTGAADEFSALSLQIGVADRLYKLPASGTFG